jgi:hypothetical protein
MPRGKGIEPTLRIRRHKERQGVREYDDGKMSRTDLFSPSLSPVYVLGWHIHTLPLWLPLPESVLRHVT